MTDKPTTPVCQSPAATKRHKLKRGLLKITQEEVVGIILYAIETDGVEAAKEFFEQMNKYCSIVEGWPQTAKEIRGIIAEAQKVQRQEQFAKELAMKKAGAPNILLMNQNEANGMKDSRMQLYAEQFNGMIEQGAEINHTKYTDSRNDE